ncbi:hypothetical protein H5410_005850 [Solanum commersonii]|uniref:Uncharacterized protein n=1 Tax=Solanum commersonii TaxID=4109 RepID=A0A9J6A893_SOLCO|nr:hypothetical protein H5410_005850 [Solanum commersonii]
MTSPYQFALQEGSTLPAHFVTTRENVLCSPLPLGHNEEWVTFFIKSLKKICNPLILLSTDVLDLAEYLPLNTWSEDFFVCGRLADHH